MNSTMRDDHVAVLLETIQGQMQSLADGISGLQEEMRYVKVRVDEIPEMKDGIRAIKAAITDQGRELNDHETRITALEAAA